MLLLVQGVVVRANLWRPVAAHLAHRGLEQLLEALGLAVLLHAMGAVAEVGGAKNLPVRGDHAVPAGVAQDADVALVVGATHVLTERLVVRARDAVVGHRGSHLSGLGVQAQASVQEWDEVRLEVVPIMLSIILDLVVKDLGVLSIPGRYQVSLSIINRRAHDMRRLVNTLRSEGWDAVGNLDGKLLSSASRELDVYDSAVETGNTALDTILTEKRLLCASRGIVLSCIADGQSLGFVRPADLYTLFGNALDNAINAVVGLHDDTRLSISLVVRRHADVVSIHMENYCDPPLSHPRDRWPGAGCDARDRRELRRHALYLDQRGRLSPERAAVRARRAALGRAGQAKRPLLPGPLLGLALRRGNPELEQREAHHNGKQRVDHGRHRCGKATRHAQRIDAEVLHVARKHQVHHHDQNRKQGILWAGLGQGGIRLEDQLHLDEEVHDLGRHLGN